MSGDSDSDSDSNSSTATHAATRSTCAGCAHWLLRDSAGRQLPMARHGFGQCAKGPVWTTYPPQHACGRHQPAAADVVAARITWLDKKERLNP